MCVPLYPHNIFDFVADFVIQLSAVALSVAQFNCELKPHLRLVISDTYCAPDVTWGLGLHTSQLSKYQLVQAMKAFFVYQIM